MSWIYLLLLFSVAYGMYVGNGENMCDTPVGVACERFRPEEDLRFPDSEEELKTLCSSHIPLAECLTTYEEECTLMPHPPPKGFLPGLLKASKAFCETNSTWFEGTARYGCCYRNLQSDLTSDFAENCRTEIEKDPNLAYLNDRTNHPELIRCYGTIEVLSCLARKISENCGKAAKELVMHFIREAGPWNLFCQDFQNEAMKLVKDLKFTIYPETSKEEFATLLQESQLLSCNEM